MCNGSKHVKTRQKIGKEEKKNKREKGLLLVWCLLPTGTQAVSSSNQVNLWGTTLGQEQQQGAQPETQHGSGVSGREVFHSCPQLPVLEVVKHPVQHGLRLREQLCEGLEQGDAHNVEEPKLQLQAAAEAKVEMIWCVSKAVVSSVCVVGPVG